MDETVPCLSKRDILRQEFERSTTTARSSTAASATAGILATAEPRSARFQIQ